MPFAYHDVSKQIRQSTIHDIKYLYQLQQLIQSRIDLLKPNNIRTNLFDQKTNNSNSNNDNAASQLKRSSSTHRFSDKSYNNRIIKSLSKPNTPVKHNQCNNNSNTANKQIQPEYTYNLPPLPVPKQHDNYVHSERLQCMLDTIIPYQSIESMIQNDTADDNIPNNIRIHEQIQDHIINEYQLTCSTLSRHPTTFTQLCINDCMQYAQKHITDQPVDDIQQSVYNYVKQCIDAPSVKYNVRLRKQHRQRDLARYKKSLYTVESDESIIQQLVSDKSIELVQYYNTLQYIPIASHIRTESRIYQQYTELMNPDNKSDARTIQCSLLKHELHVILYIMFTCYTPQFNDDVIGARIRSTIKLCESMMAYGCTGSLSQYTTIDQLMNELYNQYHTTCTPMFISLYLDYPYLPQPDSIWYHISDELKDIYITQLVSDIRHHIIAKHDTNQYQLQLQSTKLLLKSRICRPAYNIACKFLLGEIESIHDIQSNHNNPQKFSTTNSTTMQLNSRDQVVLNQLNVLKRSDSNVSQPLNVGTPSSNTTNDTISSATLNTSELPNNDMNISNKTTAMKSAATATATAAHTWITARSNHGVFKNANSVMLMPTWQYEQHNELNNIASRCRIDQYHQQQSIQLQQQQSTQFHDTRNKIRAARIQQHLLSPSVAAVKRRNKGVQLGIGKQVQLKLHNDTTSNQADDEILISDSDDDDNNKNHENQPPIQHINTQYNNNHHNHNRKLIGTPATQQRAKRALDFTPATNSPKRIKHDTQNIVTPIQFDIVVAPPIKSDNITTDNQSMHIDNKSVDSHHTYNYSPSLFQSASKSRLRSATAAAIRHTLVQSTTPVRQMQHELITQFESAQQCRLQSNHKQSTDSNVNEQVDDNSFVNDFIDPSIYITSAHKPTVDSIIQHQSVVIDPYVYDGSDMDNDQHTQKTCKFNTKKYRKVVNNTTINHNIKHTNKRKSIKSRQY